MSESCIFCRIACGQAPGSFVYEGEHVLAFMSLEQPNPYKVLVVPRAHVATLYDLSDEQAAAIFQVAVRVARAIRSVSACPGLNVVQANGAAGQQDVWHFHLHLLPRLPDDTLQGRILLRWDTTPAPRQELDRLAADLRAMLLRAPGPGLA